MMKKQNAPLEKREGRFIAHVQVMPPHHRHEIFGRHGAVAASCESAVLSHESR